MKHAEYFPRVNEAAKWLEGQTSIRPKVTVVLSGGLDDFVEKLTEKDEIEASHIPHFPSSRAEGHAGTFIFGKYQGTELVVMRGRQHIYEGHPPHQVVFPHFVMNKLGSQMLINTNATGGINHDLNPGDIVLLNDHINFMGVNPLIGIAIQRDHDQFPCMTNAYTPEL